MHVDLTSGVFEVLNENNQPSQNGKLIFTSFTTYGTPLIRYDIGDSLALSSDVCHCGNNNPLIKEILGRTNEYIYSEENGKINLGNISNTVKGVDGIIKFQVVQNQLESIVLRIVVDDTYYSEKSEIQFLKNWRERVGMKIIIKLEKVKYIQSEQSGKFRMVINNITGLIEKS